MKGGGSVRLLYHLGGICTISVQRDNDGGREAV